MRTIGFIMTLGLAAASAGAGRASEEEQRQACMKDAVEFCSAAIPNRQAVAQCLTTNRAKISAPCRAMLDGDGRKPGAG